MFRVLFFHEEGACIASNSNSNPNPNPNPIWQATASPGKAWRWMIASMGATR